MVSIPSISGQPCLFPSTMAKVCARCGRPRPLSWYYVKDKRTNRYYSWCRDCHVDERPRKTGRRTDTAGLLIKTCAKCMKPKPLAEFHVRPTGKPQAWCKACTTAQKAEAQRADPGRTRAYLAAWQHNNPERCRQYSRTYYARHSEERRAYRQANRARRHAVHAAWKVRNSELLRAKRHARYWADPDSARARCRRWYWENKPTAQAMARRWRQSHSLHIRAAWHRRQALIRHNGGSWTEAEWLVIKAAQDYQCLLCGRREPEITLTVDHIIPLTRGGVNDARNLQGLCVSCNSRKGNRYIGLPPLL